MKNRKRGFSLVELLIVLAVIAALIATITPVAMNAIKKSKATQVAQNLKTLASSFENYLYVNSEAPKDLSNLGRDIDSKKYEVYFKEATGTYNVIVVTSEKADAKMLTSVVADIIVGSVTPSTSGYTRVGDNYSDTVFAYYSYTFNVY